jgi:hypothetical protein
MALTSADNLRIIGTRIAARVNLQADSVQSRRARTATLDTVFRAFVVQKGPLRRLKRSEALALEELARGVLI